jgi:histidinol-phosphate aminotransferase
VEAQYTHDHLANPVILPVNPYQPGKSSSAIQREFGLQEVVKLASNENAAGPSPLARKALELVLHHIHLYPDDGGEDLKHALARKHGVSSENVILGHGATDILDIIVRAFVCPTDEIISAYPGFPWFQILGQLSGAKNVVVPLRDHRHDLQAMGERITPRTKLILIANPNNPTGTFLKRADIESFLRSVPRHVVVVLDEAYIDYVDGEETRAIKLAQKPVDRLQPVIVVRTFSKISGLAGLRIGYAIAEAGLIRLLEKARQPFNTTMLAHVAAKASLQDLHHIEKSRKIVAQGKIFLYEAFKRLRLDFVPTDANFIYVDFHRDVKPIFHQLMERGFIIRPAQETCARITIGLPRQNAGLVRALKEVLTGRGSYEKQRSHLRGLHPARRGTGSRSGLHLGGEARHR